MADAVPQDEIPQVDVIPGANGDAPVVLLNGVAQPEGEQQDQGDLQPDPTGSPTTTSSPEGQSSCSQNSERKGNTEGRQNHQNPSRQEAEGGDATKGDVGG